MALYVAALDYDFNPNTAQLCGSVIIQTMFSGHCSCADGSVAAENTGFWEPQEIQ